MLSNDSAMQRGSMNLDAKRAFVLADWMKIAHRCESEEEFLSLLGSEESRIARLQASELDQIIARDKLRLDRFNDLYWVLEDVELKDCCVYPRMGQREWAVGNVVQVAERFVRMEPIESRVWKMKLFASIFSQRLPLIVLKNQGKQDIDDGSHRAIATQLSGINTVKAYIGTHKSISA
jgi:hypothetical protein